MTHMTHCDSSVPNVGHSFFEALLPLVIIRTSPSSLYLSFLICFIAFPRKFVCTRQILLTISRSTGFKEREIQINSVPCASVVMTFQLFPPKPQINFFPMLRRRTRKANSRFLSRHSRQGCLAVLTRESATRRFLPAASASRSTSYLSYFLLLLDSLSFSIHQKRHLFPKPINNFQSKSASDRS